MATDWVNDQEFFCDNYLSRFFMHDEALGQLKNVCIILPRNRSFYLTSEKTLSLTCDQIKTPICHFFFAFFLVLFLILFEKSDGDIR